LNVLIVKHAFKKSHNKKMKAHDYNVSLSNSFSSYQQKPLTDSKAHVDFYVAPCRSSLKYREISRNKLDEMQIA